MMESPPTTPGKSIRKKNSFCSRSSKSNNNNNNPYSSRGRDKFSALLAELEEKRRKILSQNRSDDVSFVRFAYKDDTDDCVPVLVKLKNDKKDQKTDDDDHHHHDSEIMDKSPLDQQRCSEDDRLRRSTESDEKTAKKKKKKFSWNNIWRFKQPSYYLPMVFILILLLLAVFGRSFVIICTSIGWYMIPAIQGPGIPNLRRSVKKNSKKEYARKLSEKKMFSDGLSSPKTTTTPKSLNNSGNLKDQSPRKHGHWKSW